MISRTLARISSERVGCCDFSTPSISSPQVMTDMTA